MPARLPLRRRGPPTPSRSAAAFAPDGWKPSRALDFTRPRLPSRGTDGVDRRISLRIPQPIYLNQPRPRHKGHAARGTAQWHTPEHSLARPRPSRQRSAAAFRFRLPIPWLQEGRRGWAAATEMQSIAPIRDPRGPGLRRPTPRQAGRSPPARISAAAVAATAKGHSWAAAAAPTSALRGPRGAAPVQSGPYRSSPSLMPSASVPSALRRHGRQALLPRAAARVVLACGQGTLCADSAAAEGRRQD